MTLTRSAIAFGLAAVLLGCGVPTDDEARVTSASDVPFGLLDEDREPVAGANPAGRVAVEVFLYSDIDERLVPVERRLDDPGLRGVFAALQDGPSESEEGAELSSAFADVDAIASVEEDGGVASVDLRPDFDDIQGADQLVALAQLVFTATGLPGVGQVVFTFDGAPVEVPIGDGSLTSGAVTRDDYETLAPRT